MPKYISTRGGDEHLSFEDAVLSGLSKNGGLLVPDKLPTVNAATQGRWKDLGYADLAFEVG